MQYVKGVITSATATFLLVYCLLTFTVTTEACDVVTTSTSLVIELRGCCCTIVGILEDFLICVDVAAGGTFFALDIDFSSIKKYNI